MKSTHIIRADFFKTSLNGEARNIGLDNLRAFCVFGVLLAHSNNILAKFLPVYKFIFPLGWLAQEVFFSLSGFLIGNQILKFANKEFKSRQLFIFYRNRWARTLPFYLIFVLINYFVFTFIYRESEVHFLRANFNLSEYVLLIQNLNKAHPYFFPEIWPMPVEEWSYLLLPLPLIAVSLFFKNVNYKYFFIAVLLLIAAINVFRVSYVLNNNPEHDWYLRKIVIYRLDALLYGLLLAILMKEKDVFFKRVKNGLAVAGIILCLGVSFAGFKFNNMYVNSCLFTLLPLFSCLLIPFFNYADFRQNNTNKMLTHVSLTSYAILLSHLYFLQFLCIVLFQPNSLLSVSLVTILYFIVLLFFSTIFYNRVEMPLRLLSKRNK